MALKAIDKVKFDTLQATFSGMVAGGMDIDAIKGILSAQVVEFEAETNNKVKYVVDGTIGTLELTNLSKDFLRIRNPNEETKVIRAKVEGVGIDIKVFKAEDYEFSNEEIISALKALTVELEDSSVVFSEQEPCDLRDLASEKSTDDEPEITDSEEDIDEPEEAIGENEESSEEIELEASETEVE